MRASFKQHGHVVACDLFTIAKAEEIKSAFARIVENGPRYPTSLTKSPKKNLTAMS